MPRTCSRMRAPLHDTSARRAADTSTSHVNGLARNALRIPSCSEHPRCAVESACNVVSSGVSEFDAIMHRLSTLSHWLQQGITARDGLVLQEEDGDAATAAVGGENRWALPLPVDLGVRLASGGGDVPPQERSAAAGDDIRRSRAATTKNWKGSDVESYTTRWLPGEGSFGFTTHTERKEQWTVCSPPVQII